VTGAQASAVVALDSGEYLWLGNQWVTGTRNDNNLLYWDVLSFDVNGTIRQFVRKDNVTIQSTCQPENTLPVSQGQHGNCASGSLRR